MIHRVRAFIKKVKKRILALPNQMIESAFSTKETTVESREKWAQVQAQYGSIEGPVGIELRQKHYPHFFQRYGRDVRIDAGCYFSSPERIVLDDGTRINRGGIFEASSAIHIGRNARIGHRCFLHSANHNIDAHDETAFFERGYDYCPVRVGDNVLVSANVSMLPGLELGSGSFVAANAVVPGKAFEQSTYLAGLPARAFDRKVDEQQALDLQPAPAVALLVSQRGSALESAAQLLASVMGMPQIVIAAAGEPLPESIQAVVCLETIETRHSLPGEVWQPSAADTCVSQDNTDSDGRKWPEPLCMQHVSYHVAVNGFSEAPGLINTSQASVFATSNAFLKGTAEMRAQARAAWSLCLIAALRSPTRDDSRWDAFFGRIGELIDKDVKASNWRTHKNTAKAILEQQFKTVAVAEPRIVALFNEPTASAAATISEFLLRHSWLMPYLVLKNGTRHENECRQILDRVAADATTSTMKSCLGLSYLFLDDTLAADDISDELLSPHWYQPDSALVRQRPGGTAIDRRPPLIALLSEKFMRQAGQDQVLVLAPVGERQLEWRVFLSDERATESGLEDLLLSPRTRAYSQSLIENWLALQELPSFEQGHFFLDDSNYHRACELLEGCWVKLFEHVLQNVGVTAVRMKPWPAGYDYSISIRYDVDRDLPAEKVRNILRIQRERLNAACGSWYFIADAPHTARIKNILKGWNQEYAHHSCRSNEPEATRTGVTAHSAGNSEYWRGRQTISGLEASNAAYAEAMLSAFALPRPGWLGEKRTSIWLTPLHFPLEGSTKDTTTEYFDERKAQFNAQIASGGMVIIGSHPDCQQSILEDVLASIDTGRCWPVTVRAAVDRVRAVFEPDNISVMTDTDVPGSTYLSSQQTLADVVVEYRHPTANADWQTEVVQLQANRPRRLNFSMED